MKKLIMQQTFLLLLILLVIFQSCKEEEDIHPEVQTLEIIATSTSSAILKGFIPRKGKFQVNDYGFIYGSNQDLSDTRGTKVSLGTEVPSTAFSKEITVFRGANQYSDQNIYARTYLANEKGVVYGQILSVVLPNPSIQSIVPISGKSGDRIAISGQFFNTNISQIEVTFGGIRGNITEASSSKITVEVPVGIPTNYYSSLQVPVVVRMAGQSMTATNNFRVVPIPKNFTPKQGTIGTSIYITGDNLPNYNYSSGFIRVFLGQTEVAVSGYSNGTLMVNLPRTVTTEKLVISTLIDGVTTVLPGEFTVVPPTITSISPVSGLPNSTFTVFGSNMPTSSSYDNNLSLKIGTIAVSSYSSSSGQITATIPNNMPAGDYKIFLTVGPHTVEAPQTLKVLAPAITSFSPTSGAVGREVLISGTFSPNQNFGVYFGSVYTNSYTSSSNFIRVNVPAGVQAGNVKISVVHGSQTILADGDFTVLAPSITSFAPVSGVAGTVITINGVGFNSNIYNTTVKFGTIGASIQSVTDTAIRVIVPSNINPGAMKLTVTINGQNIISTDNFTVTN